MITQLVIHIKSQVKTRQSQSYKFKKIVKHLLKLLDKMFQYKMDPTGTGGATERTRDAGRMEGRSESSIPPNNFVVWRVYIQEFPYTNRN